MRNEIAISCRHLAHMKSALISRLNQPPQSRIEKIIASEEVCKTPYQHLFTILGPEEAHSWGPMIVLGTCAFPIPQHAVQSCRGSGPTWRSRCGWPLPFPGPEIPVKKTVDRRALYGIPCLMQSFARGRCTQCKKQFSSYPSGGGVRPILF